MAANSVPAFGYYAGPIATAPADPSLQIPAATATRPRISRVLIANLLASIGFGLIAMTICLPSMSEWGAVFDATQGEVQITFSSFVIAFGAAQLVYGPLSDRYGRRTLLLCGFALACAGSLAGAWAPDLFWLALARFVQGAGAAAGMVLGRAMVQDFFTGAERPRIMAYTGMVLGLCPPSATIIGGQLHVLYGWRANFICVAILAAALFVCTALSVPRAAALTGERRHWLLEMWSAYTRLARVPAFRAYTGILAMCSGSFYVFLAGAPIVFASYGVGPARIGWFIMFVPLSYIAGNFLTSRLLRHNGESRLMMLGQLSALIGIAIVGVLAFAEVRSPFAVALPLMLLGIGHGLLMPSTLAGTVSLVPALAGAAAAVAGLLQQFTGALGGYLVGLVEHDGATNIALLMFAFMLVALFNQLLLGRAMQRMPGDV